MMTVVNSSLHTETQEKTLADLEREWKQSSDVLEEARGAWKLTNRNEQWDAYMAAVDVEMKASIEYRKRLQYVGDIAHLNTFWQAGGVV